MLECFSDARGPQPADADTLDGFADLYPLADRRAVTSGQVKAKSSYLNLIAPALREVS